MGIMQKLIRKLDKDANRIYIVGGFLRDKILNREIKDYDFAVDGDAEEIAKLVADRLGGSFVDFMGDKGTYRVVAGDDILDFSNLKGKDIYEDLIHRDFTMNAMAMRLIDYFDPGLIIDPFNGLSDILNKKIRHVGIATFEEDPLRMLRAVRFASTYKFNIDENTKEYIRRNSGLISEVSPERIMAEIYTTLRNKDSHRYIWMMEDLKLIENIFEEVARMKEVGRCYYHVTDAWVHSIKALEEYEDIINSMRFPKDVYNLVFEYLNRSLTSGNKVKDVLKLAVLFHDIGKPESIYIDTNNRIHFYTHDVKGEEVVRKLNARMKISKKESSLIRKLVLYHMKPIMYFVNRGPSNKSLFNFFSELGDNAIGCLLLSQADFTATRIASGKVGEIPRYSEYIIRLLKRYIEFKETEKHLLSPLDIIINFDLQDKRKLGQILYEIRKNRFYGDIEDKNDAIEFVKERMKMEKI